MVEAEFLLSGCPVPTVLVLDSGTRLDAWRAVPVQTDPGYVREMRLVSKPSASSDGVAWRGQAAQPTFLSRGKATSSCHLVGCIRLRACTF